MRDEAVYPVLGLLPLGMFLTVVLFDFAGVAAGAGFFAVVGFWTLAGGLVTGVLVTAIGLLERPQGRAEGIQALLTAGMLGLLAMVWLSRWERQTLGWGAFLLELLALAAGVAGTWLTRDRVTGHKPTRGMFEKDREGHPAERPNTAARNPRWASEPTVPMRPVRRSP